MTFDDGGAMHTNREQTKRGAEQRAQKERTVQSRLDRRRADMQEAEGHAGSIPRGNQQSEDENVGNRRHEWDRVLGH
jgi:hypothetical protein